MSDPDRTPTEPEGSDVPANPLEQVLAQNAQMMQMLLQSQQQQAALLERLAAPQAAPEPQTAKVFTIRNLRGTPFSLRLTSPEFQKAFRVELKPRGLAGDMYDVPEKFRATEVITDGLKRGIIELLTAAERAAVHYSKGALQNPLAVAVVRPGDSEVRRNQYGASAEAVAPPQEVGVLTTISDPIAQKLIADGIMEVLPTRRLAPRNNFDPEQVAKVAN